MRAALGATVCAQLLPGARGHGGMYEPPPRSSMGFKFMQPGCQGGACFWYTGGSLIDCKAPGAPTAPDGRMNESFEGCVNYRTAHPKLCCDGVGEPTLNDDPLLRTYNVDGNNTGYPCGEKGKRWECGDWTKHNPWRKPGSAPVFDPCGAAGGSQPVDGQSVPYPVDPPPFSNKGDVGSRLPKLLERTVWIAGSEAEVGWGIFANHGGGYSYRLCPAGSELTEACFQKMPLDFAGETQWLQFGPDGMDTSNRTEIPVKTLSAGTFPAGSQWRRNPIPACAGGPYGTGGGTDPIKSLSPKKLLDSCEVPLFPPAVPGVYGFGLGGTPKQVISSEVGIVDKVKVPNVPPGDYVLGWRWDCEQTSQVWQSCGDVTIKAAGEPTKPFTPLSGCDVCCGVGRCANCTKCVNDKTGDCAFCHAKFQHPFPEGPAPFTMSCLGHEAEDGGASPGLVAYTPADTFKPEKMLFLLKGISPGCPKCWADKDACTARDRGA